MSRSAVSHALCRADALRRPLTISHILLHFYKVVNVKCMRRGSINSTQEKSPARLLVVQPPSSDCLLPVGYNRTDSVKTLCENIASHFLVLPFVKNVMYFYTESVRSTWESMPRNLSQSSLWNALCCRGDQSSINSTFTSHVNHSEQGVASAEAASMWISSSG